MEPVIDESNQAQVFRVLSMGVMPVWGAMIVVPPSGLTSRRRLLGPAE